jgi:hypothetical protein
MKLITKLVEVMKQVKYIQKTGYNSFHKYKYATEADVNERIREELAKLNVLMIPSVKSCTNRIHTTSKGNLENIITVEMEFTFYDGDSDEKLSLTSYGEGQDSGDKGVYKAITGAQKYALMKAFMIPTGDDPEADSSVDERNQSKSEQDRVDHDKNGYYNLRDFWVELGGAEDKFDEWHKVMYNKGATNKQMQDILLKKKENK